MIGVGLIGCGNIAQGHAYALRLLAEDNEVRPVAVTDLSADAVTKIREICPFDRAAPDAQALIDDPDVDCVFIVTPTKTHRALVHATVDAGKPFLCEKPLAADFATVRTMCDRVRDDNANAQVGFHSRFHPLINELKGLVDRGELGRPMAYVLRDDQFWPTGDVVPGHSSWRSQLDHAGGGALVEHSIHSADILSWIFGQPASVFPRSRKIFGYDVEDAVAATIEHTSGTIGTLVSIFNGVRGREERRLEVFFEHGAVEVTTDFLVGAPEDSFLIQRPDQSAERLDVAALLDRHFDAAGVTRRKFFVYLYPAARSFVHALRSGDSPTPGFEDAFVAHAFVEAGYRSAACAQPVALIGDLAR